MRSRVAAVALVGTVRAAARRRGWLHQGAEEVGGIRFSPMRSRVAAVALPKAVRASLAGSAAARAIRPLGVDARHRKATAS